MCKYTLIDKCVDASDSVVHMSPTRKRIYKRPKRVGQHQSFVYDPVESHGYVDGGLVEPVAALVLQPKSPYFTFARPGTPYHVHVVALPRGGHFRTVRETPRRQSRAGIRADEHVYPLRAGDVEVHTASIARAGYRDLGVGGRGQLRRRRVVGCGSCRVMRNPAGVVGQLADEWHAAQKFRGAIRANGADHLRH